MSSLPENPLPHCPYPTNCYRESRYFDRTPNTLFAEALGALRNLGSLMVGFPKTIEPETDEHELHATFAVFLFTDDLSLRVEPYEDGAVLHVRSASRVGRSDLGTNKRRVRALFDALG